jgi:hypothetical protein
MASNGAGASSRCVACGRKTARPPAAVPGLKGEDAALREPLCSPACAEAARRFAARRSAQLQPARAGVLVAALGLAAGLFFLATGRELGRLLLVFSLLAAGTIRLAYPDAVAPWIVRGLGLGRARLLRQWAGVALGLAAVALGAFFLLGR